MTARRAPHSLRARLTIMFVGLGGLLIVVASIGVSSLLSRAVWRPLDAALEEESVGLALILQAEEAEPADLGESPEERNEDLLVAVAQIGSERDLGPAKFVLVADREGASLAAHGKLPRGFEIVPTPGDDGTRAEFLRERGHVFRVVRHPIRDGGWITIGVRADRQVISLTRARLMLSLGAMAFLIVLGGLAWLITTRATSEIDGVATELEALEADSLHRRLTHRDTTEVDRLATALNRLLARLDHAVSHLRRFTADAAHELRTPVAALRARIEATLATEASVDHYRDGLLDALTQTERLSHLAEDLLTLSGVESAESLPDEEVDLSSIASEVCEFLEPVAEEQGRTLTISAEPSSLVRGSSKLLKRVFVNLLDNAFRHTASGGRIDIKVTRHGSTICSSIRDEGPGFDTQDPERLFRRFGHGSNAHGGAGLGLAICEEIVRKHHGRIQVASDVATGTLVTFKLPATRSS